MNLDRLGYDGKARLPDFEPIDAKRQTLDVEASLIAGCQRIPITIRLADNLNRCFHAQPGRVTHLEVQFATSALAKQWQGAKEKKGGKSLHEKPAPVV